MFNKRLLFAILFALVAIQAFAATTSWLATAGNSDWSNAANWTNGVPDATTDAFIVASTFPPKVNIDAVCLNLTINSGTLFMRINAEAPLHTLHVFGSLDIKSGTTATGATGPGTFNMGDATTTVDGSVNVEAPAGSFPGTLFDGSLSGIINIAGNLTLNTFGIFNCGQSTVNFNGTGPSAIPEVQSFWNLQISKTTVTGIATLAAGVSGATTIANQLILTSGTFNAGSATVVFTGSNPLPMVLGGIFVPGTSVFRFQTTVGAHLAPTTYYDVFIDRSTYTFTSDGPVGAHNFTVMTGNYTAGGALTISNNFDVQAGTVFSAGTFTHNVANNVSNEGTFNGNTGAFNIQGNFTNTGTFNANTNTMNFNGALPLHQQLIAGVNYNTLKVNNPNPVTSSGVLLTANATVLTFVIGDASPAVDAVFDDGGNTLSIITPGTGTLTFSNGVYRTSSVAGPANFATVTIGSNTTFDYYAAGAQNVRNFIGANYSNLKLSGSGVKTTLGTFTVDKALTVASGVTLNIADNSSVTSSSPLGVLQNFGTISVADGILSAGLNVNGPNGNLPQLLGTFTAGGTLNRFLNFNPTAAQTINLGTSGGGISGAALAVTFNGGANQITLLGTNAASCASLTVVSTPILILTNAWTVAGATSVAAGSSLTTNASINTGTFTNNAGAGAVIILGGLTTTTTFTNLAVLTNAAVSTITTGGSVSTLTLTNHGTFTSNGASSTFTTNGVLTNDGTLNCNGLDFTVSGSGSVSNTGTINLAITGTFSNGNTIVNNFVQLTPTYLPGIINYTGGTTGASTFFLSGAPSTYTGSGTFNFSPTGSALLADAITLSWNASFTSTGTVTFGGARAIRFSSPGATTQNLLGATVNVNNTNVNRVNVVPAEPWSLTNLTIGAGATLSLAGSTLTVTGNITENATGLFYNTGAGTIAFTGAVTGAQSWELGANKVYNTINLTVNQGSTTTLAISQGNVAVNTLTFGTTSLISAGGHDLRYVTLAGAAADNAHHVYNGTVTTTVGIFYVFPVGDATIYKPLTYSANSTSPGVTTVGFVTGTPGGSIPNLAPSSWYYTPPTITIQRAAPFYWIFTTGANIASATDLFITLSLGTSSLTDNFQVYTNIRPITRLGGGTSVADWTRAEGTDVLTGAGNTISNLAFGQIGGVAAFNGSGNFQGTQILTYGLALVPSVTISGKVYYADLSTIDANTVDNVTVHLANTDPVTSMDFAIGAGLRASGYTFTVPSSNAVGYTSSVTVFPAWSSSIVGISSTDALAVRNVIVGRTTLAGLDLISADVDNSGGSTPSMASLSGTDVMIILQKAAGTAPYTLGVPFPRGDWYTTTATTATNLVANVTGQVLQVIAIGDVVNGAVPSALTKRSVTFANNGQVNCEKGKDIVIPVQLTSGSIEAGAFTMSFTYPSNLVQYKGISSNISGITAVEKDGHVKMYWIDMSANHPAVIAQNDNIVELIFTAKESMKSTDQVSLNLESNFTSFGNNDAKELSVSLNSPMAGFGMPTEFNLSQNYPNPFNPSTTINYDVPEMGRVTISIYNAVGQQVEVLFNGIQAPGKQSIQWNARNFASGLYFVKMIASGQTKSFSSVKKMMLLK